MLTNYVELVKDVPTRLHFTDHYYVERLIMDKELKREKMVRSLVMWVDRLNNEPCARTLSVLSKKLADFLEPYLEGRRFRDFDFVITKRGEGFLTDWQIRVESHTP